MRPEGRHPGGRSIRAAASLTRGKTELVAQYFTPYGNEFGHMTPKGNEHAAQLLAAALKEQAAPSGEAPAQRSESTDPSVPPN